MPAEQMKGLDTGTEGEVGEGAEGAVCAQESLRHTEDKRLQVLEEGTELVAVRFHIQTR